MKTTIEAVAVITNSRNEAVGIVRKDPITGKNLIFMIADAKMDQIADFISGKFEEPYATPAPVEEQDSVIL